MMIASLEIDGLRIDKAIQVNCLELSLCVLSMLINPSGGR